MRIESAAQLNLEWDQLTNVDVPEDLLGLLHNARSNATTWEGLIRFMEGF